MRGSESSFLRLLAVVFVGLLSLSAAINLVMDPYDIARVVSIPGVNADKGREWELARLTKSFRVRLNRYNGLALGTSQIERSFDPDHAPLRSLGLAFYNAGFSEQRLYESALLLRLADWGEGKPRVAVVSLDFSRYQGYGGNGVAFLPRDWNTAWMVARYLRTLVAFRTLRSSWATAVDNFTGTPGLHHLDNGLLNAELLMDRLGHGDVRSTFDGIDRAYALGPETFRRVREHRDDLLKNGFDHDDLRRLMEIARERNIRVLFMVPPSHARQMEILRRMDLWSVFAKWKCEISDEIAREGRARNVPPFELWDFSGYNPVTEEPVPARGSGGVMRWYNDPIHFNFRAGRAIADRLFRLKDPELVDLDGFGRRIDPLNITETLLDGERERARFLVDQPEVAADVDALTATAPRSSDAEAATTWRDVLSFCRARSLAPDNGD